MANLWDRASTAEAAVAPDRNRDRNRGKGGGGGKGGKGGGGKKADDAGITSGGQTATFNRDPFEFLNAVMGNYGVAQAAEGSQNPFQSWLQDRMQGMLGQWETNKHNAPNQEFVNWFNTRYASPAVAAPANKKTKDPNDAYLDNGESYQRWVDDQVRAFYADTPWAQGRDVQSFGGGPTRWAAF